MNVRLGCTPSVSMLFSCNLGKREEALLSAVAAVSAWQHLSIADLNNQRQCANAWSKLGLCLQDVEGPERRLSSPDIATT